MELSPKQAAEYILGIDLWRQCRDKEKEIYASAGLVEPHGGVFDLNFRDSLQVHKARFQMLARHAGREAVVLVGTVGVADIAHFILHGM